MRVRRRSSSLRNGIGGVVGLSIGAFSNKYFVFFLSLPLVSLFGVAAACMLFFLYLRVFLSLVIYSFCYVWEELLLVLLGFGWALEYMSV
jgi:hypothetical protein